MILVFGGAFNGKLGFVKEEFEVSEEDIFYCNEDKINFLKRLYVDYISLHILM